MTISTKQRLNVAAATCFMLVLALAGVLSLESLSGVANTFAETAGERSAKSLESARKIDENLQKAVRSQEESLGEGREVEQRIVSVGKRINELSEEFKRVSSAIEETNRQVQIVGLKAKRINGVLGDSVEALSGAFNALPDGDTRFELEDVYDELYDTQDLLQKEVVASLRTSSDALAEFRDQIESAATLVSTLSEEASEQVQRIHDAGAKTEASLGLARQAIRLSADTVADQKSLMDEGHMLARELAKQSGEKRTVLVSVSIVSILVLLGVAFLISAGIIRDLRRVIASLINNKDSIKVSTTDVMRVGESLTAEAVQLAGVTEDTSSSAKEIQENSHQNATLSHSAREEVREVLEATRNTSSEMESLQSAIGEIRESGDEIAEILVNIEEVAFQTNLLALNAAVEAARAGEAGAGFAVVADEVRALATRSSEAARKTSDVVSKSQRLTRTGSDNCKSASESLEQVLEKVQGLKGSFDSIAKASAEQEQSLEGLGKGVLEMDSLSNELRAKSSDAVSASGNLDVQLSGLGSQIESLALMVEGTGGGAKGTQVEPASRRFESSHVSPAEREDAELLFEGWNDSRRN